MVPNVFYSSTWVVKIGRSLIKARFIYMEHQDSPDYIERLCKVRKRGPGPAGTYL